MIEGVIAKKWRGGGVFMEGDASLEKRLRI